MFALPEEVCCQFFFLKCFHDLNQIIHPCQRQSALTAANIILFSNPEGVADINSVLIN